MRAPWGAPRALPRLCRGLPALRAGLRAGARRDGLTRLAGRCAAYRVTALGRLVEPRVGLPVHVVPLRSASDSVIASLRSYGYPPRRARVRPDVVFTRRRLAVFVDGCLWHRCPDHGTSPRSNSGYWREKLDRNVARDRRVDAALAPRGLALGARLGARGAVACRRTDRSDARVTTRGRSLGPLSAPGWLRPAARPGKARRARARWRPPR